MPKTKPVVLKDHQISSLQEKIDQIAQEKEEQGFYLKEINCSCSVSGDTGHSPMFMVALLFEAKPSPPSLL